MTKKTTHDPFGEGTDLAPAFVYAEGDFLVGHVVRHTHGYDLKYRDDIYPIVVVALDDDFKNADPSHEAGDHVSVHVFSRVLERLFLEWDPKPGERIALKRSADRVSKISQRTYSNWLMSVDGRKLETGFAAARERARRSQNMDKAEKALQYEHDLTDELTEAQETSETQDSLPF